MINYFVNSLCVLHAIGLVLEHLSTNGAFKATWQQMPFLVLLQFTPDVKDVTTHLWNILKIIFCIQSMWMPRTDTHSAGEFNPVVGSNECFRESEFALANVLGHFRTIIVKCEAKLTFASDVSCEDTRRMWTFRSSH